MNWLLEILGLRDDKLSKETIREILYFIAIATKEGSNIIGALEYFTEENPDDLKTNDVITAMIKDIKNGLAVEEALSKYAFINDFQYSILKATSDKKEGYSQILAFAEASSEADLYYLKDYVGQGLLLAALVAAMPLNKLLDEPFFEGARQLDASIRYTYHPLIENGLLAYSLAGLILGLIGFGVYFYRYTYREDLKLHYKLFPYKSITDSVLYASILKTLFDSGVKSYDAFHILGTHIEPKSARDYMLTITSKIKNKKFFKDELQALGFDKFTIFFIKNGFQTGNQKESWSAAKNSTVNYKKEKELNVYHKKVRWSHVIFMFPIFYLMYVALMAFTDASLASAGS